jgi:photosystem II stability/assembly factor-like uncharacterized protein
MLSVVPQKYLHIERTYAMNAKARRLTLACLTLGCVSLGLGRPQATTTLLAPSQSAAGPLGVLERARLLSPMHGWLLAGGHVWWTNDDGVQWSDITPPLGSKVIDGVFFLNESSAWTVLHDTAQSGLYVAVTSTGGKTWSINQLAKDDQEMNELYGNDAQLSFSDSQNGWLLLRKNSSSAWSRAGLFVTADGGASWSRLPDPPVNGQISFTSRQTGWLVGGALGDKLYVTQDGGLTWNSRSVNQPANISDDTRPLYSVPAFRDAMHGTLLVSYALKQSGSQLGRRLLVNGIYKTADGGNTWQLETSYNRSPYSVSATVGSTVIDAILATNTLAVGTNQTKHLADVPLSLPSGGRLAVDGMTFITPEEGWLLLSQNRGCVKVGCVITTALVSTADGGTSFHLLSQTMSNSPVQSSPAESPKSDYLASSAAVTPGPGAIFSGQTLVGLDSCNNMEGLAGDLDAVHSELGYEVGDERQNRAFAWLAFAGESC